MAKFTIILEARVILLNVALKRKASIYSIRECEGFFIRTINVQHSNPPENGDMDFGNTNNQNLFTEHLSDNSSNQVFDDNLKATAQKNISTQSNKGNYDK